MYNYNFHSQTYMNLLWRCSSHDSEIRQIFHYFINHLPILYRMKKMNVCFGLQINIEAKCCEYFERIWDISGILIGFQDFNLQDEP